MEKQVKITETVAKVADMMEDEQRGIFLKALYDYNANGKVYDGKDIVVQVAFTFAKKELDDLEKYRMFGKIGGMKSGGMRKTEACCPKVREVFIPGGDLVDIFSKVFGIVTDGEDTDESTESAETGGAKS